MLSINFNAFKFSGMILLGIQFVACNKVQKTSGLSSNNQGTSSEVSKPTESPMSSSNEAAIVPMCKLDAGTNLNSGPAAGCYCYPDIVPRLTITLREAVTKFRSKEGVMQNLRCQNILGEFSEAFGGWDLEFPTDYASRKLTEDSYMGAPCGSCIYQVGTKVCYEAKILGKSYMYDVWDINYALYGTLQKLCGVSENEAWAKVIAWKKAKGEYSKTVWFWFKYGYMLADSDMPSTSEAIFRKLEVPMSDIRYENKCNRCPDGAWKTLRDH